MSIYASKVKLSRTDSDQDLDSYPILERHWPDFATEVAATEFGGSWVHPDDREFVDRAPPHTPAPSEKLNDRDIVGALLSKKRRAA